MTGSKGNDNKMVKIEYLADYSGASRFGTCAGCSKGSKEDPEMVRVTFWTGSRQAWQGTSLCLCKECRRELYEKI